jgi:RNA polymerase sigma factor (sigma-70 family)
VNSLTDQQLLRDYTGRRSEAAFAELVRRHVDFVHSAALRMVRDAHLAEDVTQSAFVALAQNACQLTDRPVLSGWLHRTAQNLAANAVRSDVRRRAREQEAAVMNELLSAEPDAVWEHIAPHLDAALGELSEPDRDALLLRYFERKSAREIALTLGVSDEAAQKRVSRAVERLREFFAKRGVTVGAGGLAVVISANAVQAAPVGLAVTISTAAALVGTNIATTATTTAVKTIAMTTLQKTLITATLAVVAGTGIYEARQASTLRTQNQLLQQQQAPLTEQIQQLARERDAATRQLAALREENERQNRNNAELLKLRGEVGVLRNAAASKENDPVEAATTELAGRVNQTKQWLERTPEQKIPELQLLQVKDWLSPVLGKSSWEGTTNDYKFVMSVVRKRAKERFAAGMGAALDNYLLANDGRLPNDLSELKPHFAFQIDDAMLQRYQLLHTGSLGDLPEAEPLISEKAPIQDGQYDAIFRIGAFSYSYEQAHALGESGSLDFASAPMVGKLKSFYKR